MTESARIKILWQKLTYLFLVILQIYWKDYFLKSFLGCDVTYWVNNWRKTCEKAKKHYFFKNLSHFLYTKSFEVDFSKNKKKGYHIEIDFSKIFQLQFYSPSREWSTDQVSTHLDQYYDFYRHLFFLKFFSCLSDSLYITG